MRIPVVGLAILLGSVAAVSAQQKAAFTAQDINAAAEYPACAVSDVNKDGKLDIISGGFWYEAPKWAKHFLREVEVIRGRFDDYSNLELDVNADGWTDIVSVNYRSKSLFWMEHPGEKIKTEPETAWKKHVIDTPGPMETGRLHDIDGDGRLDILPNGTDFAAWYSLDQEKTASGKVGPRFVRHDLPREIAGHGVGFGDVNGDGRGDIVGPRGWLEAPEDRRRGRWTWHADWQLHRDASIPILVQDVDGDGDNDLIWGRGHHHGLYWLEQTKAGESGRAWTQHAIDTSWSQPHSLLWVDLDGNGKPELVAGKRYLGHEGKDPGEWDPIVAYSYEFDPAAHTFARRHIASDCAGFGLDPKAADLSGDGLLDLVAADRNGLSLIIQTSSPGSDSGPFNPIASGDLPPRQELPPLLESRHGEKVSPIKTAAEWGAKRSRILAAMELVMGRLPDSRRRVPLDVQITSEEDTPKYKRIKLTYAAEPGDRVPALLLVPKILQQPRAPAMLCLHPTNADGKAQTAGLVGEQTRHYGHQLAELGFVCLIPDYPSFGDYKAYDFKQPDPANPKEPLYVSGTMKAIWNNVRALDLLETLDYVDGDKIGCIGHSLGGHNALFTAAFDQRIKAAVTSCGFTGFADYYEGNLTGWTSDRYMPRIRDVYGKDPAKMPFDFHEVLGAIAPRPVFVAAPLEDANFDNAGVRKVIASVTPVYELLGANEKLRAIYPDCKHDFPDAVREEVYGWLKGELGK